MRVGRKVVGDGEGQAMEAGVNGIEALKVEEAEMWVEALGAELSTCGRTVNRILFVLVAMLSLVGLVVIGEVVKSVLPDIDACFERGITKLR